MEGVEIREAVVLAPRSSSVASATAKTIRSQRPRGLPRVARARSSARDPRSQRNAQRRNPPGYHVRGVADLKQRGAVEHAGVLVTPRQTLAGMECFGHGVQSVRRRRRFILNVATGDLVEQPFTNAEEALVPNTRLSAAAVCHRDSAGRLSKLRTEISARLQCVLSRSRSVSPPYAAVAMRRADGGRTTASRRAAAEKESRPPADRPPRASPQPAGPPMRDANASAAAARCRWARNTRPSAGTPNAQARPRDSGGRRGCSSSRQLGTPAPRERFV
jgi:hypothetical protein